MPVLIKIKEDIHLCNCNYISVYLYNYRGVGV